MATASLVQADVTNAAENFSIQPPKHVDVYHGDGAAATFTIPTGANYVVFSKAGTGDFYASTIQTAAIASADVTDGTASMANPSVWRLSGISETTISIIAPAGVEVTLAYYK